MRQWANGSWIADDTAALTADVAVTLRDTFTVTRKTFGLSGASGPVITYPAVAELTGLDGAISNDDQQNVSFDVDQARITTGERFTIHLPPDVFDQILLTDRIEHDRTGLTYEIISIESPTTEAVATPIKVALANAEAHSV